MSNYIEKLSILESKDNKENVVFGKETIYRIPIYQREFAWTDTEIDQLIEDLNDCEDGKDYYLGSLIVNQNADGSFEVIDGQQRLTAIFLILNILKNNFSLSLNLESKNLSYDCRDSSTYTISHLQEILDKVEENIHDDKADYNIVNKAIHIRKEFVKLKNKEKKSDFISDFERKLKRTKLFRIKVPYHTDRNRYFETMNIRGEQLELVDILKAKLMGTFKNNTEESCKFATIWDACKDMMGYVQMHFTKPITTRENLFGTEWNKLQYIDADVLTAIDNKAYKNNPEETISILDIINDNTIKNTSKTEEKNTTDKKDSFKRSFDSIIDFRYFLIHTLRIFILNEKICFEDDINYLEPEDFAYSLSLDDKKLLDNFVKVLKNGKKDGCPIDEYQFSKGFIKYLLTCRFLFDKYIVKREYKLKTGETSINPNDGVWSLKKLKKSKSRPLASYCNSFSKKEDNYVDEDEEVDEEKSFDDTTDNNLQNEILMLQACLRVSYTSPKTMHWITKLLNWLIKNTTKDGIVKNDLEYKEFTESILNDAVKNDFFEKYKENESYKTLGVNTPHVVFNYLDYLLWKDNTYLKYIKNEELQKEYNKKKFDFKFRNSVEHWYPRNPIGESNSKKWDEKYGSVDRFGNLCLLQSDLNSKFSNFVPSSKQENYNDTINDGSLKLRIMRNLTQLDNDKWKTTECRRHEDNMLTLLRNACKDTSNTN